MARVHRKKRLEKSCYDMALERVGWIFDRFDRVVVSFSGGKDSTAVLHLCLEEARRRGRLPLDVVFFDEECIPPETVEYVGRVCANPDLRFRWLCLPLKLHNACSRKHPVWRPWEESARDVWVRELPPLAERSLPGLTPDMTAPDTIPLLFGPDCGSVASVIGIRTQESMTRYTAIATKPGFECFSSPGPRPWITKVYPIYDWNTEDVWRAPALFGWDYNRVYDVMRACGLPPLVARCSPTFGAQTNRRLWSYAVCWPDLWARMTKRVHGAATALRYANTEMYGIGAGEDEKPDGMTWQEATMLAVDGLAPESKKEVSDSITKLIREHRRCYKRSAERLRPIPDGEPDPVSGYCWRYFYPIAANGADKMGRLSQKARTRATVTRRRNQLCMGTTEFNEKKKKLLGG